MMASNFTMRFQRSNGSLDIIIKGDFDGSSAHELLEALRRKSNDMQKIIVNTDGLNI
jgi:anti-anti-sigma regulatory factor